jgi:hypothetical protein
MQNEVDTDVSVGRGCGGVGIEELGHFMFSLETIPSLPKMAATCY